jgi:hypothetical protein
MMQPPEEQARFVLAEDFERRYAIEQTRMSLEAGWLGKIFGSSTNAPTIITGFVVGILTLTIIVVGVLFVPSKISVLEYLDKVPPIMTLVYDGPHCQGQNPVRISKSLPPSHLVGRGLRPARDCSAPLLAYCNPALNGSAGDYRTRSTPPTLLPSQRPNHSPSGKGLYIPPCAITVPRRCCQRHAPVHPC